VKIKVRVRDILALFNVLLTSKFCVILFTLIKPNIR
jgi:hypothetical protein